MELWRKNNLAGSTFERWKVIKRLDCGSSGANYLCQCKCGTIRKVAGKSLKNGDSKSCGCLQKELIAKRNSIHGHYYTRLHRIWSSMKDRCKNPKSDNYNDYGERGIEVCNEWDIGFEKFYKWSMDNGYTKNLTIDRKDNNGNYEPSNCRWITMNEQQSNKRCNKFLTVHNKTQTIAAWSRETGIKITTLHYRINHGWNNEKALDLGVF
jgi:hypothetical protein